MYFWITMFLIGVMLSGVGLLSLVRCCRRGEVTKACVSSAFMVFVSFSAYVTANTFQPELMSGIVGILALLPVFASVLVMIHEYQRPGIQRGN